MPPVPVRFVGREAVARFFATVPADGRLDRIRLMPSSANRQPAVAAYMPDDLGTDWAYGIMVLAMVDGAIQAITGFQDASLFDAFDLPQTIP
jgi:RNA polymerase sigma-70 factor, ECF subfamily